MNFSDIKLPSNRKFGFFFTIIFLLVSIYFFFRVSSSLSYFFLLLALVLLLTTLIKSSLLLPFNKAWMGFGFLLGKIVNPIVLGAIFFFLFTPISLLMRLFGRDELLLKLNNKESYWKERKIEESVIDRFKKQF